MSSDFLARIDEQANHTLVLHDELVTRIATALEKERADIERALYLASLTLGVQPLEVAGKVSGFLSFLVQDEEPDKGETKPLPFIGRPQ